ncbi:MAG: LL-diaminopimelate aminotransferase [Heliobacteriaceae bacterium]|jgi:LL-diaminopimelate aminotransferase|nr:LL-diaminopimelate aminotransferase [Heliobacteriaceae bacterium]
MKVSERLEKIPPYLFAEIDRKIAQARAKGIDIISLGIGDPDKPTLPPIVEEMHRAVDNPANHDYPPYNGTEKFRKASADWMKCRFGVEVDADTEVLANIGSKEAIAHIFFAFVDAGDYTLIPDPGYPVYKNATIFAGGTPYQMPLLEENGFLPDFDKIPPEIAQKSKLMFLNYPNNPTGAVADLEFFKKAVDFCKKYDILLCHDQAYCEMTYDGYIAPSVLEVEGAKDIAIEFFSHSKSYNMTGWRVGFVAGNADAVKALGTIKNNIDSGVFKAVQDAAATAYDVDMSYICDLNKMYQQRRDAAEAGLKELGWSIKPSKATFYLWLPVPKGYTSEEFVTLMLEKAHVVVPPGNGYGQYGEGYFRIALTKDIETIRECINRMKNAGIRFC